jgi:hypothetical protein
MSFWSVITAPARAVYNLGKSAVNGVKSVVNFGAGTVKKSCQWWN